jgi:hypothetical protein
MTPTFGYRGMFSFVAALFIWVADVQIYPFDQQNKDTGMHDSILVFTGEYWQGRGPCLPGPNGTRRWFITAGFTVEQVHSGSCKINNIQVNPRLNLQVGQTYRVKIRLTDDSFAIVNDPSGRFSSYNAIEIEDVLSFELLK